MNIRQTKTLESFLGAAEVLRMVLERPNGYAASSDQRTENECRQAAADFEYGTARLPRKMRDFLQITTDGTITVFAPRTPELGQNIGLRRSTLDRRSEPFHSGAELTFPVDTLDLVLQRTREDFFDK